MALVLVDVVFGFFDFLADSFVECLGRRPHDSLVTIVRCVLVPPNIETDNTMLAREIKTNQTEAIHE